MAPISPWFSTHYGSEVSYSKNWVFPSDLLWFNRWKQVLSMNPRFVQIISWNDYGESHYVGPLSSKHADDGNSKWTNDMPHLGFLEVAKPFIKAFKDGAESADGYVGEDRVVYWYRPAMKGLNCDGTDGTGKPDGWDSMSDSVFVVSMLKEAAEVTVNSGDKIEIWSAPKGVSARAVPMGVGKQKFAVTRNGATVLAERTSLKDVSGDCPCGLYNFNTFVGAVGPTAADKLDSEGLSGYTRGRAPTCPASPLLGVEAAAAADVTLGATISSEDIEGRGAESAAAGRGKASAWMLASVAAAAVWFSGAMLC